MYLQFCSVLSALLSIRSLVCDSHSFSFEEYLSSLRPDQIFCRTYVCDARHSIDLPLRKTCHPSQPVRAEATRFWNRWFPDPRNLCPWLCHQYHPTLVGFKQRDLRSHSSQSCEIGDRYAWQVEQQIVRAHYLPTNSDLAAKQ